MPFPITCAACQKTFSIADDVYERKVKGRVVTIKCKQCQASIRVDSTKDTPAYSVADSADSRPAAPAPVAAALLATASGSGASSPEAVATPAALAPMPALLAPVALKLPPGPAAHKGAVAVTAAVAPDLLPVAAKRMTASATKSPLAVKPPAVAIAQKAPLAAVALKSSFTGVAAKSSGMAASSTAPVPAVLPPTAMVADAPPVPPAAAATETLWAVEFPDGEDRELTQLQIQTELAAGALNSSALVWRDGMDEWLELGQVPELKALSAAPKSKAKAARPEPPPQRPRAPSVSGLGDMPPQRPKAPSTTGVGEPPPQRPKPPSVMGVGDLPPQRPQAPSTSGVGGRPPQPEPPLAPAIDFASHQPKGAPPALSPSSKSTASGGRAPTPPVFSAGPAASATLMQGGAFSGTAVAAAELPAFVPAAALIAAPFARPAATPIGAVAPIANVEDWPRKSRMPLIIASVVLLAGALLILFLTRPFADEIAKPTSISALPAMLPNTARADEPSAAATGGTATGAAATGDDQNPAAPSHRSSAALEPPGSTALATPNADFATLFASGARAADERHGAPGPVPRFDANAAKIALASAASQAPACREKGGPAGKATVVVTFETSGKVSSAAVSDPPFAGTASGACIAAAMKRATVPAFSGLPGTVTKVISLQ